VGFGRIAAFAAIANLAMHAGLSDMALFRYAKRASYGFASIFGMFLGHYLAWICAGIMGAGAALLLRTPLPQLDPGAVAYRALGVSGILAVVFAGWTTSNPTLYRAGLALQAITPNWSRTKVTIITGIATTIIACFPFVFTRLLDFVGLYGLLLSPAGVIVLTEHYLFPKLGLPRYWASRQSLNMPALAAWAVAVGLALYLDRSGTLHLFYLFVPTALLTMGLYVLLVKLQSPAAAPPEPAMPTARLESPVAAAPLSPMRRGAGALALAALIACLYVPARVLGGAPIESVFAPLLAATAVYFAAGAFYAQSR
jgi:NCS1 family nucleobase:cation symporter-1